MGTQKKGFANFADINLVILQLIEDLSISITDVTLDPKKRAYKTTHNSDDVVIGGIAFKLQMRGRPANEKILINIVQAHSQEQGTSISAAQSRAALMRWMFDESESLFVKKFGRVKGKNQFDINDYALEDDVDD